MENMNKLNGYTARPLIGDGPYIRLSFSGFYTAAIRCCLKGSGSPESSHHFLSSLRDLFVTVITAHHVSHRIGLLLRC